MIDDKDELRLEAERFGLTRLTDRQIEQFAKARMTAEGLVSVVPRDLPIYDEPAHTFRAGKEVES